MIMIIIMMMIALNDDDCPYIYYTIVYA